MVEDPNRDIQKYRNQREQVKGADIPDSERKALLEFGEHKFNQNKASTAKSNLFSVLKLSKLAQNNGFPPLIDWDSATASSFFAELSRGDLSGVPDDGYSENYHRSLRQHARNFSKYNGAEWHDEVPVGAAPESTVTRDDLVSQDEISALFGAAEHPRDKCLLALPLATFQRNAALRSLQIKHIHLSEKSQTDYLVLNPDASGRKGATGKRPLTWASAYVRNWLDVHPRGDEEEAPLLCVIGNSGNAERGTEMSKDHTYNERLRTIAERAGLSEERYDTSTGRRETTLTAHLLRHTGITRAGLSDKFSDQVIKRWAGWTEDSERLRDYVHLTDDDILSAAAEAYGDGEAEHELAQRPEPSECDRCGHATEEWMKACPECTLLLDPESAVGDASRASEYTDVEGGIPPEGHPNHDAQLLADFANTLGKWMNKEADSEDGADPEEFANALTQIGADEIEEMMND